LKIADVFVNEVFGVTRVRSLGLDLGLWTFVFNLDLN